ncbi:pyridoxamine 5'-phosphate oxidase family protein [Candidatus Saccharibacteria bacterium]|nr:pyridoxamine 5'-phosphate oxidase family protein [Candidatus Saccharibacteria bacterium]
MKTPVEIVNEIFHKIPYLNLATVSDDGKPWNTAVWYAKDEDYNLYFVSPKNTVHAKNIHDNNMGFVTIYDSTAPEGQEVGLYIEATVSEVKDVKTIVKAISCLYKAKKNKRQSIEFISTASRRIYKVTPHQAWINDAEEQNGLFLDYRIEVPLNELTQKKAWSSGSESEA